MHRVLHPARASRPTAAPSHADGQTLVVPALLFPVIWVAWLVLPLAGGIAAAAGTSFRYPLTLRIVR